MKRSKRLLLLLCVLAAVCLATAAVMGLEQRQEEIKNSGETILEIDPDSVQSLAWQYEDIDLAFHKGEDGWLYDGDENFPVSGEKIADLLGEFEPMNAAFVIENVEDYGQYGLDDPLCTIQFATADADYTVTLGNYSTMDQQRYLSIGDGNVYLVEADPLDVYDAELPDVIAHDEIPRFTTVNTLRFAGAQSYTVAYQEGSTATYCADDVYFVQQGGGALPLDTDLVEDYLSSLSGLDATDYVTYNATADELAEYGLDNPELTVTVGYTAEDEDGNESDATFVLNVSRAAAERAATAETAETSEEDEDEEEEITAYVRVGDSQIVYQITADEYKALMAAGYNDLRHREILTADAADITGLDITLEGETYSLTSEKTDDERVYSYNETEVDADTADALLAALTALAAPDADSFTDEQPTQQQEIALTVYLDNETTPQVELALYRCDGTNCLATVNGTPVCLVPRADTVTLIEAVHTLVLS